MENIKYFLENSSLHGVAFISTTRNYVRIFWILIVLAGFIGAGVLIHTSFDNWTESPVKTTIETLPIEKITFPKVTVCPPENTYTDLNYDLMMAKNMVLDNETRYELLSLAIELLQNYSHDEIMGNLSMIEDNDRYHTECF